MAGWRDRARPVEAQPAAASPSWRDRAKPVQAQPVETPPIEAQATKDEPGFLDLLRKADARAKKEAPMFGLSHVINPLSVLGKAAQTAGIYGEELLGKGAVSETLQDAGQRFANSAALGFASEADAIPQAVRDRVVEGGDTRLKDLVTGKDNSLLGRYRELRDKGEARQTLAAERSPYASFMADVGGGFATPLPGKGLGQLLLGGAAMGAAHGLGSSDADLTKGEVGKAGADALLGGGFGLGGSLLGQAAGNAITKAAPRVMDAAGRGLEALGISQGRKALLNGARSLKRDILPDDAVREALRPGIRGEAPAILPFGTAKGAFKRLSQRTEDLGEMYSDIIARLEDAGVKGPEARAIVDKMVARAAEENITSGANKAVPSLFMREALNVENLAQGGRLGLSQAEKVKRALQAQAKGDYFKTGAGSPLGNARKEVASLVRQANEDAIEAAGKTSPYGSEVADLAESFVPVKRRLGRTIQARDAAEEGAQKGANRSFGGIAMDMVRANPTPGGIASVMATGGGVMNRLSNTGASLAYGSGALTKRLANALRKMPQAAGNRLGSGFERGAMDPYILEYIRALRSGNEDEQP